MVRFFSPMCWNMTEHFAQVLLLLLLLRFDNGSREAISLTARAWLIKLFGMSVD